MRVCLSLVMVLAGISVSANASEPVEYVFPSFGVKAQVPSNWHRIAETRPSIVARWAVVSAGAEILGEVTIEMEASRGRTVRAYADEVALRVGGDPRAEVAGVSDRPAFGVEGRIDDEGTRRPIHALVTGREDYVYLLSAVGHQADADLNSMLERLRESVALTSPSTPASHLKFRPNPWMLFDRMKVKMPDVMRPRTDDVGPNAIEFEAFNFRSRRADMVMTLNFQRRPQGQTLEAIGRSLIAQLRLPAEEEQAIRWKSLEGGTPRIVSDVFDGARAGARRIPLQFALVELNDRELALIGFVFPTTDRNDQTVLENCAEEIVEQIEVVGR